MLNLEYKHFLRKFLREKLYEENTSKGFSLVYLKLPTHGIGGGSEGGGESFMLEGIEGSGLE